MTPIITILLLIGLTGLAGIASTAVLSRPVSGTVKVKKHIE
jgi:hypothetical protein